MNVVIRERDKQIIYLAIFIIVVIADVFLILGWQLRSLLNYYKIANERKEAITTLKSDILNLDSYKKEVAKLDEKVKSFKLLFTDEEDVSGLIENISGLANSSSVKIIQIKPVKESSDSAAVKAKDNKFTEIGIQIAAKADFHQMGNFISKIESSKSFLKVSSLEIETDSKDYYAQNIRLSLASFVNTKDKSTKEKVQKYQKEQKKQNE